MADNPQHGSHAVADSVADRVERKVASGELRLSELGRRLLEARRRIEQSGVPLLSDEELDREYAERREP